MNTFQYRGKQVSVFNDFINDKPDWRIEYPTEDNMLIRYRLHFPVPEGNNIKVKFTRSLVRPLTGEEFNVSGDRYYEPRLAHFYNMNLPANLTYGEFASIHAINGMIARLPEIGGSMTQPQTGYRVFLEDGTFYQPVVFDVSFQNATVGNNDGSISVNVVNAQGNCEFKLDEDGTYQAEPEFTGLGMGAYKIFVRDEAGTERFTGVVINEVSLEGGM